MGTATLDVRWAWLFLDVPRAHGAAPVDWWAGITRTTPSPWRGDHDEFTTLVPTDGPAWLKLQRVDDLACVDRAAEVARHVDAGATAVAPGHGWTVPRDPWGRTSCCTDRSPATGTT